MRPSDCKRCMEELDRRMLLSAEVRHTAFKFGAGEAKAKVDEALDEFHANGHEL